MSDPIPHTTPSTAAETAPTTATAEPAPHEPAVAAPAAATTGAPAAHDAAHAPPPPPATGTGMGVPLDIPAAIDSVASAVTSVLPTSVASTFGLGGPAAPEAVAAAAAGQTVPPALPARPEDDPKIAALRAMFPDFDVMILQTVLDSVRGDQDRAIDVLLGMNDPDYVSEHVPREEPTDLDEELARRLTMEDSDARAFAAEQRLQSNGGRAFRPADPRESNTDRSLRAVYGAPAPSSSDDGPPGPTMRESFADVQEQISKVAEVGRKTFTSLFSKVKDKIAEFEQGQTAGYSKYDQDPSHPYYRGEPPAAAAKPAGTQPGRTPAPNSYFDPASPGPSGTVHQGDTPQIPVGTPGYVQASTPPALATVSETRSAASGPTTPGSIDPSKIGMLPKRPVSLVRDASGNAPSAPGAGAGSAPAPARKPEDDDDLGYL